MTLLKINTPIGYKAAVYHSQLGIAHIVKGKLIVGATANKKKDFSVGDSFAKTVANTPDQCESIDINQLLSFLATQGWNKIQYQFLLKNKVSKKPTIN